VKSADISTLSNQAQLVLSYRYRLNGYEHKTNVEIANLLGVSRQRINHIEQSATWKLYFKAKEERTNKSDPGDET
jgi:DNA-directed RNA polymerase sigma subunit (sigma70/sigma32)